MKLHYEELGGVIVINATENEQIESEVSRLRSERPESRIVVVSPSPNWESVRLAFESGASDYLIKRPRRRELAELRSRQSPLTR